MQHLSFDSFKLSICIPTYNRPKEFERGLRNILPQLTPEVELVIRDDSPGGESRSIFEGLIKSGEYNYQYHVGEKIGLDLASLFLFEVARSEFVWLFSDDDLLLDGGVAAVLKLISEGNKFDAIWMNFATESYDRPHVRNRESGLFNTPSEVIDVATTGIGLVSTQVFRRRIGLNLGLNIAKKHLVGFSFASTAVFLSVVAGGAGTYFLKGPYILNYLTGEEEWMKGGKEIDDLAFKVYGIEFHDILWEFKQNLERRSIRSLVQKNFNCLWQGMVVGYVRGWRSPVGKLLPMLKIYWSYPTCWVALALLLLPRSVCKILYKLYKLKY